VSGVFCITSRCVTFDAPFVLERSDHGFFVQGMSTVDAGELGPLWTMGSLMLS